MTNAVTIYEHKCLTCSYRRYQSPPFAPDCGLCGTRMYLKKVHWIEFAE